MAIIIIPPTNKARITIRYLSITYNDTYHIIKSLALISYVLYIDVMAKGRGKFSKRGLVLTVIILAVITAASFIVYVVPQNSGIIFVTTDYAAQLDSVSNIHNTLQISFQEQYEMVLSGQITVDEYVQAAQVLSDQTVGQISILATTSPPAEWSESYSAYTESLRAFNSLLRESVILMDDMQSMETLNRIAQLNTTTHDYIAMSASARP